MSTSSEAEGSTPTAPTPRRWTSEENTFLWIEARKESPSWERIASTLDRTVAGCRSHFTRLYKRNKYLAQNKCHRSKHASHKERVDCCTMSECPNYYGKWK